MLSFGGSTGESVNGNSLNLVVRGDTGSDADTVNLQQTDGAHFAPDASGVTLSDPAYSGAGTLYNVYSDGSHQVAVEQGVTVTA